MKPITTIIVDDQQANINTLQTDLYEHADKIEILATFTEPTKALIAIKELKPDVLFLDIEMPVIDGITLARQTSGYYHEVVFVTNFNKYMRDAFKVHAFEFLIKPIKDADLAEVIESLATKALKGWNSKSEERIDALARNNKENRPIPDALYCQRFSRDNWDLIKWSDIVMFEMDTNSELGIFTNNGQHYFRNTTLALIEKFIDEQPENIATQFIKINRVHIVNYNYIKAFNPVDSMLKLKDEIKIHDLKPLKVNDNVKAMFRKMMIPAR
ncbi:MAG TPA: response regulator transcription factor [Bacteroidia bacterium]|nr:response regulator transcription factor [Bacteroidia bacterium]